MVNNTEVRAAWNITDGPDKVVADAFGLSNASNMRSAADRADDLLRAMDNQSMRKLLRKGGINGNNLADVFKSYTEKMDL
jgi:hypothetical protein